jgi:hypothetical protein
MLANQSNVSFRFEGIATSKKEASAALPTLAFYMLNNEFF